MLTSLAMLGMFGSAVLAGLLGSMLGLGGGIIIIPVLTLLYGIDVHAAAATSLLCVVATSTAGTASYLRRGVTDLRLGLLLEVTTVAGAIAGGYIAFQVETVWLRWLFILLLLYTAWGMWRDSRKSTGNLTDKTDIVEGKGRSLAGSYYDPAREKEISYHVHHFEWGMLASTGAGLISGLLGVGGGIIKVPVMRLKMGVPMKVAAATSNFMIGITAAASVMLYFHQGVVNLPVTAICALGILLGATIGPRLAGHMRTRWLQRIFILLILLTVWQMTWNILRGGQ